MTWEETRARLRDAVDGVTTDEYFVEVQPADIRAALERDELLVEQLLQCQAALKVATEMFEQGREQEKALRQRVEELERELACAHSFHKVAVKERDYERAKLAKVVGLVGDVADGEARGALGCHATTTPCLCSLHTLFRYLDPMDMEPQDAETWRAIAAAKGE